MKLLRMILAVAGLTLAGSLFAQHGVQATIPFSFYVGNSQLMPSGTYTITPCLPSGNAAVMIRNCDNGLAVYHLTQAGDSDSKGNGKLLFHKYGDRFFLSEVQHPSLSTGLILPVSGNEKKVQNETATVRTFETITVPKENETTPPEK
jgi:hypothetical protein